MNILTCTPDGKFYVVESSAAALEQIAEPCWPVAMAGPERGGKSTFSTVLSDFSTFPSQSGHHSHTKAVWVALKPSRDGFLLLDFEGFSSNPAHNTRLVVLAVLLADVIIFNTPSIIQSHDVSMLQCAGSLSSSLGQDGQRPALLWLLRNYDLDLELDKINYLQSFIARNEESFGQIRTLFSDLCCVAFPPPNQVIPSGSRTLAPSMQTAEKHVRQELVRLTQSRPQMRGPEFVCLLRAACQAVNNAGEGFDVGTAWQERQLGLARSRRIRRQHEIQEICRDKFADLSPQKWKQSIYAHFPPEEIDEFDELFAVEHKLVIGSWQRKTKTVLDGVNKLLKECVNLDQLAAFLKNVVAVYEPKELIEPAVVSLLPELAKTIAAAAQDSERLLGDVRAYSEGLRERLQQLEQVSLEKAQHARARLEELQKTLSAQHAAELDLRDQELKQEKAHTANLDLQLRTQGDELTRVLSQMLDVQNQLEELEATRVKLEDKLATESATVVSLKRKVEAVEETGAVTVKKMREDFGLELKECRSKETRLNDELQSMQEQLEQAVQDKEVETRRALELESSRKALHDDNLRLRADQFKPAVSTAEITLRAQVTALTKQVNRLRDNNAMQQL